MQLNNKYLFIFAISIFLVISISGAGMFMNDEWVVGQQLDQLTQGHQLLFNEGKYGYYANGTIGNYMLVRSNILIYSMALPIISLPMFFIFTSLSTEFTRLAIILFWGLLGLYIWNYIKNNIFNNIISHFMLIGIISLTIINLLLSTNFIMSGKYIPYEIIPIVFTNILLYGIFSVTCFKISELLFDDKFKQLVGWILCISMTSMIFWSTTLKDHMLIATLIMLICYFNISCNVDGKYCKLCLVYFISGLIIWIRPEIGLFVIIGIIIYDFYYCFKYNIYYFIFTSVWLLPGCIFLLLNNYFVTGNLLSSPFLISFTNQASVISNQSYNMSTILNQPSGNMINHIISLPIQIINTQICNPIEWIKFIFSPSSGALGAVVTLCLFLFGLLVYIKHRPPLSPNSNFLLITGICSIIYYVLVSGVYMSTDGGIMPDIRYLTPAYAALTLFALTILPYELNYRKIFKNIFIFTPIIIILSLFIISVYPPAGYTYKSFRIIFHIISTLSLSIMMILLVNDRNNKPILLERIIPIIIASAFTWQIMIIFIYRLSKSHYYPMFLPITELLYKLLFGGLS